MILYNCYLNFGINNKLQDYMKMFAILNLRIITWYTTYPILLNSHYFLALIFIYLVPIHYTRQYIRNYFNNIGVSNLVKMRTLVLNT